MRSRWLALAALAALFSCCGCGESQPAKYFTFPLSVQLVNPVYEPGEAAMRGYTAQLDELLGCTTVNYGADERQVRVLWLPVAEMPVAALAFGRPTVTHYDWVFSPDYQNATPDEIGRVWLGFIGWMTGLAQNKDPDSVMYNHATHAPSPPQQLIDELGGLAAAQDVFCSGILLH